MTCSPYPDINTPLKTPAASFLSTSTFSSTPPPLHQFIHYIPPLHYLPILHHTTFRTPAHPGGLWNLVFLYVKKEQKKLAVNEHLSPPSHRQLDAALSSIWSPWSWTSVNMSEQSHLGKHPGIIHDIPRQEQTDRLASFTF